MSDCTPDQQAMWDALGILGFDLDGNPSPVGTLISGGQSFREYFIRCIHEARADHDAAIDEVCMSGDCA